MVSSEAAGNITSQIEITHLSSHGIWVIAKDREFFLSYTDFPWFKEAPAGNILNITEPSPGHFYWPDLGVDLGIETIEHPERFPHVANFKVSLQPLTADE